MYDYMAKEFVELLFKDSFRDKPKRQVDMNNSIKNTLGFSHIAYVNNDYKRKNILFTNGVRTFQTFLHQANDRDTEYFTPNTFYSSRYREDKHLRWINCIAIDIDCTKPMNVITLLNKIKSKKLPSPTAINKTPNGWHIYWVFKERIIATKKSKYLVTLIQKGIAEALNGDMNAIGCSRLFRLPSNLYFFKKQNTYLLKELQKWFNSDKGFDNNVIDIDSMRIRKSGLLNSDAVKELLKGVDEGQRNAALYCLAKVYQADGFDIDDAIDQLVAWNDNNHIPLAYKEIVRTINSAYKNDYHVPTNWILRISGKKLSAYNFWYKHKQDRKVRNRHHFNERVNDIVKFLEQNNGYFEGSQKELAEAIKTDEYNIKHTPLSSLKECLRLLREGKLSANIEIKVVGKGRGAKTILRLIKGKVIEIKTFKNKKKFNKIISFNNKILVGKIAVNSKSETSERGSPP